MLKLIIKASNITKLILEVFNMSKLSVYNRKRNFNKTKEPVGKSRETTKKLRFCIQHHIARKDHYDLRLEWNGVLISWAVPKGPSYNPKDKRLAIMVEDHPIDYRNFEGTIPKEEYGGGTVMLWDKGYWEPIKADKPNFKESPVKFILKGTRLKGMWTLVKLRDDNNWLLIKDEDEYHLYDDINEFNTSIKTNRTMEEITNHMKKIEITNPDKIIYKNPKVTKMDIVNYYKKISKRMLPLIENRLISTIRYPNGSKGSSFFKKHFENLHNFLGKKRLTSKNEHQNDYYYIKDINGLISEVQMNSYEFHIWGGKIDDLRYADILVFDLDPDEHLSLTKLREGVKDLKNILDEYKLDSFLKTSGGKGYHIVVKLKEQATWTSARKIARNIAKLMEAKWPDKYTSNMKKEKRKGKIFIDWVRNTKGATSVAPYSLRIRKKLTVSMPISWNELDKVKPDDITIEEALKRLKRKDPWQNYTQ